MRNRDAWGGGLSLAILFGGACADDGIPTQADGTSDCGRVHEGDLYILEDSDLTSFSDLSHVTGNLHIRLGTVEQKDLSFLNCVETIGLGLIVKANNYLETTEGLPRLTALSKLVVAENPRLRVFAGFEQIDKIDLLDVSMNDALQEVHLESLESIERLNIGYCMGPGTFLAGNDSLAEVGGFASLASVGDLMIRGNEALVSTQVLDALASNGAPPLDDVRIMWNPKLPEQEVNAKLDALGVEGSRWVCGNAGGVQDECDCGIE
ncbi:MAG: hypothetical protein IPH07_05375 [Deltaproteobacteria bacterium]|nr:hypothetical protein [Deltaproteobacteria bacterium]MBP7287488.1 hypothetical protein [Nannocystaceae bacterium]